MALDLEDKKTGTPDEQLIAEAKERFDLCVEAERTMRESCLDDLKFRSGDQWPEKIRAERQMDGRPCLTINRLPQFLRQVTNDQRQNRPAIQVNPVDDNGDPDTAEVLQGIIRHIEYDSNADVAYDTAFEGAATIGFGYFRVITEFENPNSFDEVIKIKRIRNPFQVYMDPSAVEPDYSDAKFGFIETTFTKEEYKLAYPNSDMAGLDDWGSIGDSDPDWLSEDGIKVVEYFYVKSETDVLLELQNRAGEKRVVLKSQMPDGKPPRGVKVTNQRDTEVPKVFWCTHNATEVLDRTEWRGKWIPIIPVLGDELDVDGKRILEGVVRHAKEAQRQYNYMVSAQTEAIALAPKAPWVVPAGSTENYPEWETANTKMHSRLRYDAVVDGKQANVPHRSVEEPAIAAITQARLESADDLKATTGIYDAQLGAKSNEQTGRAILARQQQGQVSNFHYIDNLHRALRQLGRILLDLIPKIYDQPRVMRIIGEDGTQKTVQVNQQFDQGGQMKMYDLTVPAYDVTLSSGNYQTRRQEAAQSMLGVSQAYPEIWGIAGDLLVGYFDWPGHDKLAERLKKAIPPQLLDDDNADPEQQLQKAQTQLQQATEQLKNLNAYAQELEKEKEGKVIENQTKAQIAQMQEETKRYGIDLAEETKRYVAEVTTKAQDARERMKLGADLDKTMHVSAHEAGMQAVDHNHESEQADKAAALAQTQQATDQTHESEMANQNAEIAQRQAAQESTSQE